MLVEVAVWLDGNCPLVSSGSGRAQNTSAAKACDERRVAVENGET
jgi:hypothetical protein